MKNITEILEEIEFSRNVKNGRISNTQIEKAIASNIIFKFHGADDDNSKTVIYLNFFIKYLFSLVSDKTF